MMYTKYEIEEIKEKLKTSLNEERYIHSLGTMETAVELAKEYKCNIEKAKIAGLLHDCAKCMKKEKMQEFSYLFEDCEQMSIKTWHAPIGAFVAEKEFGVSDSEILSAIRWHTIGKKGMSDFEKIIFIADKTEPRTREAELRVPIWHALQETKKLNSAMLESFKITIQSLAVRELPICYQTIEVYNSLLQE